MMLYHGTTEKRLNAIIRGGIKPRRITKDSNWDHTFASNSSAVYLSVAYPLYFAMGAVKDDDDTSRLMVLEIDDGILDIDRFCPDEDFLAQADMEHTVRHMTEAHKQQYYKQIMHRFGREVSLKGLGNCAYRGSIPPEAIKRVCFVTQASYSKLVMAGADPSISLINYALKGDTYRAFSKWLFDPDQVSQVYEEYPLGDGTMRRFPQIPMLESREGIEVVQFSELSDRLKSIAQWKRDHADRTSVTGRVRHDQVTG